MTELLVTTREAHSFWGARKLLVVLQGKHPRIRDWTAPSTVADLLARRGLVERRRTRRPTMHPGVVPLPVDQEKPTAFRAFRVFRVFQVM